jgi:hypothetical protein
METFDTSVLIAIVSASSVLLGAAISQGAAMFQSWMDRRHKREILLRTKYEEFGQHFLASTEMPGRLLSSKDHEEMQGVLHQTAANQAHLLALIYFPPLREPIERYISSYQNLCLVVADLYFKNPNAETVGGSVFNHTDYQVASITHRADKEYLASLPTMEKTGLLMQAFSAGYAGRPDPIDELLDRKRERDRQNRIECEARKR